MTGRRGLLRLLFLLVAAAGVAFGDYLEVSRSATIKAEPVGGSTIIARVAPDTYLHLLDEGRQTKGYYHVYQSTPGQAGWIYRTLVRRHSGEFPVTDIAETTTELTTQQEGFAARHLRLGQPRAVFELVREGYALAADARLKIPLWVQYELSPEDLNGPAERSNDFRADTAIPIGSRSALADYSGSGLDRGHQAPAADMNRSESVMSQSFLLSNMSPQVGIAFNRHIWRYLEDAVRGWVQQRGSLTIITGPVFAANGDSVRYRVIGSNRVAVPTHFFKIVVDSNDPDNIEALAFLLANRNLSGNSYSDFLTTIDAIEASTGLDFLSALPIATQQQVESYLPGNVW